MVGGFNHLEKYESQWGWDYPIYIMENKSHVPNHQPVMIFLVSDIVVNLGDFTAVELSCLLLLSLVSYC